jgi:uncharacterized membrane protein YhaH (DUF805 family)
MNYSRISFYFSLTGRIGRSEYLLSQLVIVALAYGIIFFAIVISRDAAKTSTVWVAQLSGVSVDIFMFYFIGIMPVILGLISSTTFCVRRLHDMNLSGWWSLTGLVLSVVARILQDYNATAVVIMCEGAIFIYGLILVFVPRASRPLRNE